MKKGIKSSRYMADKDNRKLLKRHLARKFDEVQLHGMNYHRALEEYEEICCELLWCRTRIAKGRQLTIRTRTELMTLIAHIGNWRFVKNIPMTNCYNPKCIAKGDNETAKWYEMGETGMFVFNTLRCMDNETPWEMAVCRRCVREELPNHIHRFMYMARILTKLPDFRQPKFPLYMDKKHVKRVPVGFLKDIFKKNKHMTEQINREMVAPPTDIIGTSDESALEDNDRVMFANVTQPPWYHFGFHIHPSNEEPYPPLYDKNF